MLEFSDDEFDHYCVVEETQARNIVRYQVFGFGKVGQRIEHARGLLVW